MYTELDNAVEQIRWRERASKSEIVRRAVEEYVKNHGAGNSAFTLDNWKEESDFKAMPSLSAKPKIWDKYLETCDRHELINIQVWCNKIWKKAKSIKDNTWRKIK